MALMYVDPPKTTAMERQLIFSPAIHPSPRHPTTPLRRLLDLGAHREGRTRHTTRWHHYLSAQLAISPHTVPFLPGPLLSRDSSISPPNPVPDKSHVASSLRESSACALAHSRTRPWPRPLAAGVEVELPMAGEVPPFSPLPS